MDPFRFATWCMAMTFGVPMLAADLAAEVWGSKPRKPEPVPATGPLFRSGVDELRTRFRTEAIDEVRDAMVAEQGAKLARSKDPATRLKGEAMVKKVAAKRGRKGINW